MAFDDPQQRELPKVHGFRVLNFVDSGAWGSVYKAEKLAGDKVVDGHVALKFLDPSLIAQGQMRYRGLELAEILMNEAGRVGKTVNVVPRTVHTHGEVPFIEMPFYDTFFGKLLEDDAEVPRVSMVAGNLSLEQMLRYSRDLANGAYEIHSQLGRAHGDLKPNNVAVEDVEGDKRLLITDLGSSVGLDSVYGESRPRDNIGFVLGRAPELFLEGNHPSVESDVWALGSMMYRMVTGEYILEEELRPLADADARNRTTLARDYMVENQDRLQRIVGRKLKKVEDKALRNLLDSSLRVDREQRLDSAKQIRETLDSLILKSQRDPWWKGAVLTAVVGVPLAAISLGALLHEPVPNYTLPVPVDEVKLTFGDEIEIGFSRMSYTINDILSGDRQASVRFSYWGNRLDSIERLTADETPYDSAVSRVVRGREGANVLAHLLTSYYMGRSEYFTALGPHGTSFLFPPEHFRDSCEENVQEAIDRKSGTTNGIMAGRAMWADREDWIEDNFGSVSGEWYCSYGPIRETGPDERGIQVPIGFRDNPDVFFNTMIDHLEDGYRRAYRDHRGTSIEDILAYALLGPDVVDEAKRITGSQDFEIYSNAVVRDGSSGIGGRLINSDTRTLVNIWSEAYMLRSGQITFDFAEGAFYNSGTGQFIDNNPYDDQGKFRSPNSTE